MKRYVKANTWKESNEYYESLLNMSDDELIKELPSSVTYDILGRFLYYAKSALSTSKFNKLKARIGSLLSQYSSRIHRDYESEAHEKLESIANNIKSLKITGLSAKPQAEFVKVYYKIDSAKYSKDQAVLRHNVSELKKCFESIPAVATIDDTTTETGYRFDIYIHLDEYDTSIYYDPQLENFNYVNTINYKVTMVTAPMYMVRLPFQYVNDSNEMYMKPSVNFDTDTADADTFMNKLFDIDHFKSWNEVFDFLDSMPYESNGALITSQTVLKITQTVNGKSKTIYSRALPTTNTLVYEDTDQSFVDKYQPL